MKAAICSRRAGKSYGVGLALIERALVFPNTKHMYLALTRDSAKRILWDDVLKTINRDLKLGAKFNETELSVRFDNGSVVYLLGADAKAEEQDKLLGQKYKTVVIDEAASFRTDLRRLVYKTIEPATIDADGVIMMIGTPGDYIGPEDDRHMFYAVTSGSRRGEACLQNEENLQGFDWVSFRWNTFDNPHMKEKWEEALEKRLARVPHFADTVEYKTEWLGEWALDFSRLVYHFREDRNYVDKAPEDLKWWVIGVDLGFNDATAFQVWGWRPYDGRLYGLESVKRKGLNLDEVNKELNKLRAKYPMARIVIDGAGKQAVEHLRTVYQLPLTAASKTDKVEFIRHMNTDLTTGKIVLVRGLSSELTKEWAALVWDDRSRLRKEKAECENHCFVAGTMVRTGHGTRPIESIHPGDLVWTRSGLRPVVHSGLTGVREVWSVETESGRRIRGTANHPFFVDGEWVATEHLKQGMGLFAWESMARACVATSAAHALSVGLGSPQRLRAPRSAVASAMRVPVATPASTTRSAPAPSATTSSASIGTAASDAALDRVASVTRTGLFAPVYNMSVAGDPEFFANDILVHNCSDAALYGWRDSLHFAVATPSKKRPDMHSEEAADAFWDRAEKAESVGRW